jgi:hypothetical protein
MQNVGSGTAAAVAIVAAVVIRISGYLGVYFKLVDGLIFDTILVHLYHPY